MHLMVALLIITSMCYTMNFGRQSINIRWFVKYDLVSLAVRYPLDLLAHVSDVQNCNHTL